MYFSDYVIRDTSNREDTVPSAQSRKTDIGGPVKKVISGTIQLPSLCVCKPLPIQLDQSPTP